MNSRSAATLPAPGMPCPECGTRIVIEAHQLLTQAEFTCAACGLVLTLKRDESTSALDALSGYLTEFDEVKKNVESRVATASHGETAPRGRRVLGHRSPRSNRKRKRPGQDAS